MENTCEDERVVRLNEDICDAMGLPWCAPVRRRKAELKQVCVPLRAAEGRCGPLITSLITNWLLRQADLITSLITNWLLVDLMTSLITNWLLRAPSPPHRWTARRYGWSRT